MRFPKLLLLAILSGCSLVGTGQSSANFTQFFVNPYSFNPSFAGADGQRALFFAARKQWVGLADAPTTLNLSYHTPLKAGLNFGLNVNNDSRGVLSNSGLLFSAAYELSFGEHRYLRFGLSAGGAWNGIDLNKVNTTDPDDPALMNALDNNFSLLGNAGLSIHLRTAHIGVAIPNLFSPAYVATEGFSTTELKPFQSVIIHSSNRFYFAKNKNIFEPYVIYRFNGGLPSQYEVAGVLHLNHVVWLGASYKQDFGISALAGFKMNNLLAIGASYSIKNTGINEVNSPSFELQLSYLMGHKNKKAEVYSFVSTVKPKEKRKKTPTQLLAEKKKQEEALAKKHAQEELARKNAEEAEAKRQQALAKKKADELAKKETEEAAKRAAEELEKKKEEPTQVGIVPVVAKTEPVIKDTIARNTDGGPRLKQTTLSTLVDPKLVDEHGEEERITRLEKHEVDPTAHHGDEPDAHPHAERHEFVQKGDHVNELDYGDYIIVGVFRSEANAKHFSDGLVKLKFKANSGHLTLKDLWYVYLLKTDDINTARTERDKYRKMAMFRDAWLLTVHD